MITKIIFAFFLFSGYLYQFFCYENVLQKQYYEWNRFVCFLWKKKRNLIYKSLILLLIFLTYFFLPCLWFLWLPILFFVDELKRKIIPFRLTKRVIRHLLIFIFLSLIQFVFLLSFSLEIVFLFSVILFFSAFLLSYVLSLLLEHVITARFLKKAKEKLRQMKELKIICITGSYGKTSTKNYVYELIKNDYRVCYSKASYNSLKGVLITINQQLKSYHEILLLEIGVDKKNGMNKFLKFLNPFIGVITCIGPQHLSTFKKIENIATEKTKLLKHLSPSSFAVINQDDPYLNTLQLNCESINISKTMKSDIYISDISVKNQCTRFQLHLFENIYPCQTYVLGIPHLTNILLAVGCAKILQIPDDKIVQGIRQLANIPHRLSFYQDENLSVIDDAYNSNVEGFCAALEVLSSFEQVKILLTPGLIETNHQQDQLYEKIADHINQICDLVVLIGENAKLLEKHCTIPCLFFNTFQEGYQYIKKTTRQSKATVLIENDLPDIYL